MSKLSYFLIIIILIILTIWGFREYSYHQDLEKIVSTDTSETLFRIEPGVTVSKIADNLVKQKLIISANSWTRYLQNNDLDTQIQAGRYVLARNMTIPEIIQKLTAAQAEQIKVRLPEGFTIAQMDNWLAERHIILAGELIQCASECDLTEFDWITPQKNIKQKLEGYLFPDTYFQDTRSVTAEKIIKRALVETQRRLRQINSDKSPHELLTIASLIEKETWTTEEKPIVAGILWGRLQDGMRLDIDATTRYALSKLRDPLTKSDLQSDDPYNTRQKNDLPPGPICAPSETSLRAAAYPQETDYRFYLHDANGIIHYAQTLAEHNDNIAKWLK